MVSDYKRIFRRRAGMRLRRLILSGAAACGGIWFKWGIAVIEEEKMTAFIEKMIEQTKKGDIVWSRKSVDLLAVIDMPMPFLREEVSPNNFFVCDINGAELYLIKNNSDEISLSVYMPGHFKETLKNCENITGVLLMRLFNIINNKLPSIEQFIESYLASPD